MIFLRRAEHQPIAADLGYDSIKLLQLQERGGTLSVLAMHQHIHATGPDVDRPSTSEAIAMLPEMLRANGFRGRNVAVTLPRDFVQIKTLRMPMLSDTELETAITFEASALFNAGPEKLTIRVIPAGEVKQGNESRMEVIVLAVETARIEALLEDFNAAGLLVDAIDFEPAALYRGIERFVRRKDDENEVNVLVDVGGRQSTIVIGRGREVTFVKTIDIGARHFNEQVARRLSLSIDEARSLRRRFSTAETDGVNVTTDPVRQMILDVTRNTMAELAREVSLCLRYYSVTFRGQRPSKVRLLGGEAHDTMLQSAMAGALTVPVEFYEPFAGIQVSPALRAAYPGRLSEWGVAFGLALRRVTGSIFRRSDGASLFGRRRTDAALVEVVDITSAINGNSAADKDSAAADASRQGAAAREVARA